MAFGWSPIWDTQGRDNNSNRKKAGVAWKTNEEENEQEVVDDEDNGKEEGNKEVRNTSKNSLSKTTEWHRRHLHHLHRRNSTTLIEIVSFIPPDKSGRKVLPLWEVSIADMLDFVHQMDPSFCIIQPHSDAKESCIYGRGDFP